MYMKDNKTQKNLIENHTKALMAPNSIPQVFFVCLFV